MNLESRCAALEAAIVQCRHDQLRLAILATAYRLRAAGRDPDELDHVAFGLELAATIDLLREGQRAEWAAREVAGDVLASLEATRTVAEPA